MKDRLEKLALRIAKATSLPNNSFHQYQMNRDFGFVSGMLQILDIAIVRYTDESLLERLVSQMEGEYPEVI